MSESVASTTKRNSWARGCAGLLITSWGLLGYLALADAVLSTDTASDGDFRFVYGLLAVATVAAPVAGIAGLVATKKRGEPLLAWGAFALSLVYPLIVAVALASLGNDGLFGPAD